MAEKGMKRGLKNRHLQLISLGGVIGSGYFLGTGYVLEKAGPAALVSYLLGGAIVLCVMLCLAELAVAEPIAGSFVTYARKYINPTWACGVGWTYWVTWVSYVPSEMIAAGIIMNNFLPQVSQLWWAILFCLLVTVVNLFQVNKFGESEFWLAIIKIIALIAFSVVGGMIALGLIGDQGYLGTTLLMGSGGFTPNGYWAIILTMTIILVNFQGTEIIGLAAGECEDPEKSIPLAVRNVTWRIIALYIIPISVLISILPWDQAGLDESVFAVALSNYGLDTFAAFFSFVVLTAALSCTNSGIYGTSRALYSLASIGMAPKSLAKLNKNGMPQNSVFVTIATCWLIIILYSFDASETAYTYLLSLSGFTGAIAWISICWSQYNFRKRRMVNNTVDKLRYKTPFFPFVTLFGIWAQVFCIVVIASTPDLQETIYLGAISLIIPMIFYRIGMQNRKRKKRKRLARI
ncbi:amino acid permease [Anaerovibrio sp.]|uniref:amino acid permease n=1 Tax=Anaerovibrio sp. TaxID=1872532 RepID=UPI00260038A2|nr:amino acid permease [Anaerovibrio sp.]